MADADGTLLAQGAEARLFASTMFGRPTIVKERFVKAYRHPQIDQRLRASRMAQEARMLLRARQAGVCTPAVYFADPVACKLHLERVPGPTVKAFINDSQLTAAAPDGAGLRVEHVARHIGTTIARLHDSNIIHGDLTTSNMVLREASIDGLVMIDFGLSQIATNPKEKAVDLYVCERAFLSTHPNSEQWFAILLDAYRSASKRSGEVLRTLDMVRARGRKKVCFG